MHQLHGDERLVADAADVVDRDDVGVRQPGHRPRLAEQPRARLRTHRSLRLSDHLERDAAIQLRVIGLVDDPHAARAQLAHQLIATVVALFRRG